MDPFSYVVAFIALIPAMALARVLGGMADLVQEHLLPTPGRVRWSGLFLIYAAMLVMAIATEWWVLYTWHTRPAFDFWRFLFLLLKPSLLFFAARLLVPDVERGLDIDLEAQYFGVLRWTVPITMAVGLLDIPDTLLKGMPRFEQLGGVHYALIRAAVVIVTTVPLLLTRRRIAHWIMLPAIIVIYTVLGIRLGFIEIR